jgi:hypothetical protein
MDDKFKFGELKERITKMKQELPQILANQAQNYFTDAFANQGFDNKPWKDVKRHDTSTSEYKYPIALRARKISSPILVGVYKGRSGGTLRRAISRCIQQVSFDRIVLRVSLPYAAAQNEGTNTIPARKFMGQSRELKRQQLETIDKFMRGLWGK